MNELLKIREVSVKYHITARALTYYEDMGLIRSVKSEDYAYRMYDNANIKRLEQVLILRKLNIGIKDIQRIFNTAGSEVVLEVLGKKVEDIDEEVALLHDLKDIVLAFIRQIEQADFRRDADVKLLYAKAKEIETQLTTTDYTGNPAPMHRLFEVAEKLEEKAVSRLSIPDNVLKRVLENVYFILGDGIAVADELGRRYGMAVYHTCDNRYKHSQNADPQYQPGLCRFTDDNPDFWVQDPADALQMERDIVHDYTPMVMMDLIQLTAQHEKVICENDIDIDSIVPIITHAIILSNNNTWDDFIAQYENGIRSRDISENEKTALISKLKTVWGNGKPENPRNPNPHGIKQLFLDESATLTQTTDAVAKHFGLPDR